MSDKTPESLLPDYIVTVEEILNRQVGTRLSKDELIRRTREDGGMASGTQAGWVLSDRLDCTPVTCESYHNRTYYMFDC